MSADFVVNSDISGFASTAYSFRNGGVLARFERLNGGGDSYEAEASFQGHAGVVVEQIVVENPVHQQHGGTLTLTWQGSGTATITDPDGHFTNVVDGQEITSGTVISFPSNGASVPRNWAITVRADNVNALYQGIAGDSLNESISFTPTLIHSDYCEEFTEGGGPVHLTDIDPDVDDIGEEDIVKLTIVADPSRISDGASEEVTIAGQTFVLDTDQTVNGVTVNGEQLDIVYTASTGTFNITNNAGATVPFDQATANAVMAGTTYENSSVKPTGGVRTFEFTAMDSGD